MILTFLSIIDADGSASRYNAKHIASKREAMRRCVINQRPTSIASDDAIRDSTFEIEHTATTVSEGSRNVFSKKARLRRFIISR